MQAPGDEPFFQTRGIVLMPADLSLPGWARRAKEAGLTTIGMHDSGDVGKVAAGMRTEAGQQFLAECRELGIEVEYELHAMRDLLPRDLFAANPEFFRMDDQGERTPDCNLCVHSERALAIAAENAVAIADVLRPTTGRYFYWGDDGKPPCRCPRCRDLSAADQALVVENHIIRALRAVDPNARLAHLAYACTLYPPQQVQPEPGVFLEYAPGGLTCVEECAGDARLGTTDPAVKARYRELLDANLAHFGAADAQVLEYWLDVSAFAGWQKPVRQPLPWEAERRPDFLADLEHYGRRGIRHLTTFACFIDADYVAAFGEPPLADYGARLVEWRP